MFVIVLFICYSAAVSNCYPATGPDVDWLIELIYVKRHNTHVDTHHIKAYKDNKMCVPEGRQEMQTNITCQMWPSRGKWAWIHSDWKLHATYENESFMKSSVSQLRKSADILPDFVERFNLTVSRCVGVVDRAVNGIDHSLTTEQLLLEQLQQTIINIKLHILPSTLCSEKKHPLLFSCITLRKSNQFEWKFQTK